MNYKNIIAKLIFSFFIVVIILGCAKPAENKPASETTQEIVDTGVIVVESSPKAAQVYVDNELKGESPLTIYNFPVGKHEVIVKKEGYEDFRKIIILQVGKTEEVSAVLSENPSQLNADKKFIDNPLYCEANSDCTLQESECTSCGCPKPINIYNHKKIECQGAAGCDMNCKSEHAECVKNKCVLTEEIITSENISTSKPNGTPNAKLNEVNISGSFITYYDFKNAMFTGTASASPDVFSSNYNTYLYFTAYSPATMRVLDKQIQNVKKEDCRNAKDTIANLYSGQTLCVGTTNGNYAAIGGSWKTAPDELEWVLFS